jgi:ABC-2 type transport system permease protein
VPIADAMLRLLFVALYVAAAMASLGAMGMAISTFTEHAVGAIAATAVVVVTSEVVDKVPQFAAIQSYLPTHWWTSFDSLLRVPVDTATLLRGLLSFGAYLVIFGSFTWARFTTADVTS